MAMIFNRVCQWICSHGSCNKRSSQSMQGSRRRRRSTIASNSTLLKTQLPPIYELPDVEYRDEEEVAMECEKARKASVMAAREAAKRRKRLRTSSNSSNGSGGSASTSTSSTPGKARKLLMDMPLPASASQGIRRPSASRSSSQRSQGSQRGRSKSLERLRLQAALRGNNYQGYRVVLSA